MSRPRPVLALAALAVALAACATRANYQKLMDSLVGADVNEVLRARGPPTQTVTMPNGNRLLVYERAGSYTTPLTVSPSPNVVTGAGNVIIAQPGPTTVTGGDVVQTLCRTNIEVDASGRIASAQFTGNGCRARERGGRLEPVQP